MVKKIDIVLKQLQEHPKHWLITGVAGFIGSHLLEWLLTSEQYVVGLDNLEFGSLENLELVKAKVSDAQWKLFQFVKGDIRSMDTCHTACQNIDYVLHQAAIVSIPHSIQHPIETNDINVGGFLNVLLAAHQAHIKNVIYASSCSIYGDNKNIPFHETATAMPLTPYAVTKYTDELYADVFGHLLDIHCTGLRYFNVFGQRQKLQGGYAAVIPKWIDAMKHNQDITIYGDGETNRDFCFIDNIVQANILAATAPEEAQNQVYNIGGHCKTTLNQLFLYLKEAFTRQGLSYTGSLSYQDFRPGDIRQSEADFSKAQQLLSYEPKISVREGIELMVTWSLKSNS